MSIRREKRLNAIKVMDQLKGRTKKIRRKKKSPALQ
jgi:hypothetical protein